MKYLQKLKYIHKERIIRMNIFKYCKCNFKRKLYQILIESSTVQLVVVILRSSILMRLRLSIISTPSHSCIPITIYTEVMYADRRKGSKQNTFKLLSNKSFEFIKLNILCTTSTCFPFLRSCGRLFKIKILLVKIWELTT